jgi:hypothetical protein
MPETSARLSLPYIQPSQAQKHVTHNEAVSLLDAVVQLAVTSRTVTAPPGSPAVTARYIVPAGATGAWAGQGGRIAAWEAGAWVFLTPAAGWIAWVVNEGALVVHDGTGWISPLTATLSGGSVTRVGVNMVADTTNRLSVAAPATLLNHDGGGHQVKVNKAAAGDTASLTFQTGFSGRAEMGLAGSDNWSVKVSADGSAWTTALALDRTTGIATGAAVTQSGTDTTAGRLMKTGDFGLGGLTEAANADAGSLPTRFLQATSGTLPGAGNWQIVNLTRTAAGEAVQIAIPENTGTTIPVAAVRSRTVAGIWSGWNMLFGRLNILGTVSQTGGVPTGAVIERGSNANGDWVRYADGTQICTKTNLNTPTASTALGSIFRSGDITWAYPVAFAAGPVIAGDADNPDAWVSTATPGTTSCVMRVLAGTSKTATVAFRAVATGRWF